ncbi:bifunctional [glutamate--ammonia ligase]-adenylyl-L-tyrosine phosphorylase/[glutamate--ammonia-ligase] adenylyltransferase [Gayadomonas joobiniege]|uniref:bifunctional [glutamate--ammonia ligase]-adenylyl-L-tyrosine phosphorylase/[glutamate--ammonia-ligase] adenylyltransferase n=1 Tax=Gayadomonas joobiniege TaxID=1234606 RepID=UPI00037C053A|nr:bifunctional [glutamate--ammonia ligase]-adenylyl-L-tyrosine phosphorylase/[glutamate--ammonia-ligase] adenylyltransferase [Gayadomonas joobiniege]
MAFTQLNQFAPLHSDFLSLPADLQKKGQASWQQVSYRHDDYNQLPDSQQNNLKWQFSMSDFIRDVAQQQAKDIQYLVTSKQSAKEQLSSASETFISGFNNITTEPELHKYLRQFRNAQMARIAWFDFSGELPLDDALAAISKTADDIIKYTTDWLYTELTNGLGTPSNHAGEAQPFFVLGMGKLGGQELNFSSDIDLIFCYPDAGETKGGRRSLSNQEFFTRLGQRLITALHQQTSDGFVYRVDMRLRPYGDSGPLVMNFNMLENYYEEQGRDWERYAMLKARIITAERWAEHPEVSYLKSLIRPFVYRRYIDFSAIESLRKMKRLIAQENRRKGLYNNIKLGEGGIREVEFIVQAFQLIRGGREPELRTRSTREALKKLAATGELSEQDLQMLTDGYYFLRKTEHILQQIADKQTQTLPDDTLDQLRLTTSMGFNDWQAFIEQLQQHTQNIHNIFIDIVREENEDDSEISFDYWISPLEKEVAIHQLNEDHPQLDADAFWQQICECHEQVNKRAVGPRGNEIMSKLMPRLIELCLHSDEPVDSIFRIRELITAICTRTAYLELLYENQETCQQLLNFIQASPWIAQQLNKQAFLLDELLDPRQLYRELDASQYKADLRERLLRIDDQDLESAMDTLRQFKHAYQLRIAAADLMGYLPLMKVSDHLTWLAEAIVEQVVNLAWSQMRAKYGKPENLTGSDKGFAVLAYGKMGGLEFGYGSDLDLVFVHNQDPNCHTQGEKPIGITQFYIRLAQRIMHLFSTQTQAGILYELDLRLRPSGNSGLLVSPVQGFIDYQNNTAWTWEHQALVRCRPVVGDPALLDELADIRQQILQQKRDKKSLKADVIKMREKMHSHLNQGSESCFDLKQDRGGITDIEFITQYIVLLHSHQHSELTKYSDNIRILGEAAAAGVISQIEAEQLIEAYKLMRNQTHKLALAQKKVITDLGPFKTSRDHVSAIWQRIFA